MAQTTNDVTSTTEYSILLETPNHPIRIVFPQEATSLLATHKVLIVDSTDGSLSKVDPSLIEGDSDESSWKITGNTVANNAVLGSTSGTLSLRSRNLNIVTDNGTGTLTLGALTGGFSRFSFQGTISDSNNGSTNSGRIDAGRIGTGWTDNSMIFVGPTSSTNIGLRSNTFYTVNTNKGLKIGGDIFSTTAAALGKLHITAGAIAGVQSPHIVLGTQTLLPTPVNNSIENNGTDLFYTDNSGVRRNISSTAPALYIEEITANRILTNDDLGKQFLVTANDVLITVPNTLNDSFYITIDVASTGVEIQNNAGATGDIDGKSNPAEVPNNASLFIYKKGSTTRIKGDFI